MRELEYEEAGRTKIVHVEGVGRVEEVIKQQEDTVTKKEKRPNG